MIWPNKISRANGRPASPLNAGLQSEGHSWAPPSLWAAAAHSTFAHFMKALLPTLACVAALTATLSLTGCEKATAADSSASLAGKPCTVQFRRDALGAAASLPIPPMTGGINGADTAISCTFKSTRDDWFVVNRAGKELWIPKSVILLIEFGQ